jgi:hypothetical protein
LFFHCAWDLFDGLYYTRDFRRPPPTFGCRAEQSVDEQGAQAVRITVRLDCERQGDAYRPRTGIAFWEATKNLSAR